MASQQGVCHSLDDELDEVLDAFLIETSGWETMSQCRASPEIISDNCPTVVFLCGLEHFKGAVSSKTPEAFLCCCRKRPTKRKMLPFGPQEPPLDEFDMWDHQQALNTMQQSPEKRALAHLLSP